jgi:hypothetical protein
MSTAEGGGNIVTDGLVLYLDAANSKSIVSGSTTWTDLSRSNSNGTLTGGPTFNSDNGGNLTFSAPNNQQVLGTTVLSPSFTVEVIFMPITMGNYTPVFTVGINNGFGYWGDFVIHATSTGAIYCGTDIATRLSPSDAGCGNNAFLVNNIYHMTFTFSAGATTQGTGILYKNSVLLNSKTMTKPLNGSTPGPYRFQNTSGFSSSMRVYGFRLYGKALSSQEILQNYNATKRRFGL